MENTNTEPKKESWLKQYWFFILLGFVSMTGLTLDIYYTYLGGKDKDQQVKEMQIALDKERTDKTSCVYTKDSLYRENTRLSIYKSLSLAMVHRDEATKLLKYKFGDIAHLKIDSSRVVIKDVIIGGSTYNYYIKYKIQYKDKTIEEVEPELIY